MTRSVLVNRGDPTARFLQLSPKHLIFAEQLRHQYL
jgi:hypothetical protein